MTSSGATTPTISSSRPTSVSHAKGRVLILGGTAQARQLADLLKQAGFDPVTSLAGVTRKPSPIEGEMRSGGFGGPEGLARYMAAEHFRAIVDATHPFATVISDHAKEAAARCGLPLVRLERPAWVPEPDGQWIEIANNSAAASAIPAAARVLLTVGRKEVLPYFTRRDISGIARMIEPVDTEVPGNWRVLLARPPFSVEEELRLFSDHAISHLVTKNSGGEETRAKLAAARLRGIEVLMIARPAKPKVLTVGDPQSALAFLDNIVSA